MSSFESLEPRRLFAAGQADASFGGGDGAVEVKINVHAWRPTRTDSTVDGRGRALLAGYYSAKQQISLTRLNADGSVDATFGKDGIAVVKLAAADKGATIFDVAADGSGRVLVMINKKLTRLTSDGAVDKSFGTAGSLRPPVVTSLDHVYADASDRPIIVGTFKGKTGRRATVVRLETDGDLDTTFGGGTGAYKAPVPTPTANGTLGSIGEPQAKLLADGTILCVSNLFYGYSTNGIAAFRLRADGALDPTYGQNGSMTYVKSGNDETDRSSRLQAISGKGAMIMLNTERDYGFGQTYRTWTSIDPRGRVKRGDFNIVPKEIDPARDSSSSYAHAVAFQADDKPILINRQDSKLFRLHPGFAYDASFASGVPAPVNTPDRLNWFVHGDVLLSIEQPMDPVIGTRAVFSVKAIALA